MTTIDEILLPVLLFAAYFFIAIQLLPQSETVVKQQVDPVKAIELEAPATALKEAVDCSQFINEKGTVNTKSDAVISRDWLETQSLANLKAIAAELCITPMGDKRSKLTWINAVSSTTPETTVLAVNLCYA